VGGVCDFQGRKGKHSVQTKKQYKLENQNPCFQFVTDIGFTFSLTGL